MGFLSNWFRKDAAHDEVPARSKREMRHRCRVEKLQDRRPMAADIHIGAVYYEDTTDGQDTTGDVIDISWTGGPAGAELTRLVIDMDKNGNGVLDPGETFFDTAGPNFGVAQFGNSDLQLVANGFTINSATTLTGLSAQWDGATSIVLTFSGFNAGEHLLIQVDVDEAGFMGSASALVEGNEFQFTKMQATFAAPHYKNVTGDGVFMDDYVDSLADRVGLPRDDFSTPPALPVPLRTAGAFFSMIPEPLSSIRGNVHADYDGDCLVDPGEPLLQGVTIELLDAQGNVLRTTLTDVNGNYEFLDLDAGTYGVREVQPAQYFNGGTLPGTVNGVVVGTSTTPNVINGIQLAAGAQGVEYNFCEKFGSISGRVHAEHDGDLLYEAGEVLVAGTTMELLNAGGVVIATTTTDANGEYLFDRLLIGTYSVREQQPALYFDSGDKIGQVGGVTTGTNGTNDRIDGIALVADRFGVRYDFVERYGSISGFVLADRNGDCIQNNGETGIAGVRMELLNPAGQIVAVTFTDANGNYKFDQLTRGTYTVREIQPAGYFDSGDHIGTVNGVITGTRSANDVLSEIALLAGPDGINYNFCEKFGSISGRVHAEQDGDLVYEAGEVLVAGTTVELLNAGGVVIATTTTDANGEYLFDGLLVGTYSVREQQPALYFDSGDKIGQVGGVTTGTNGTNDRIDGIALVADRSGVRYDFVERYGSISGFVLADKNGDCVQNNGETGIAGVRMELLNPAGQIVAVTFTDANGNYKFDQLTRGTYTVREIQPAGYFDSGDHIGTVNGVLTGSRLANDVLGEISLVNAPDGINYNFCENPPAQLSGVVFQDGATLVVVAGSGVFPPNIYDGRLTSDDTRLAGVTLRLSRPDGQPIFDVNGNRVLFAVTDSLGRYSFAGLPKGTYIVTEAQPADYLDWIDTPGSTGGIAIGPDTLSAISLNWGDHSQQNNFSEVRMALPPFIVNNPPEPPPPFTPNPQAPPPAAPPVLDPLIVQPNPLPDYYDNGIVGYTWHLSVVNGGRPRTSRLTQSQLVASEREIAELEMERPDWGAEAVKQGRFILRTGEDDQPTERELVFGVERGTPVVGDFNGDGNTDVGVYRFGTWFVDLNGNGQWDDQDLWAKLGRRDDLPVTGDWDGDGKVDIAIFGRAWPGDPRHISAEPGLPSAENAQYGHTKNVPPQAETATMGIRSMQLTSAGKMRSDLIDHVFLYGWGGDVPIAGDWTNEGQEMIGIFRDGNWKLDLTGDGKYTDEDRAFSMGQQGDKPVIGDFNGDTIVDLGVYRDGLWHIDTNNDGVLDARDRAFTFGESGDKPVVGDWDGDGVDDPGLYRDGPKESKDSQ